MRQPRRGKSKWLTLCKRSVKPAFAALFLFSRYLKAAAVAATRHQEHDPILFDVTRDQAELSIASSYVEFCNEELIYAQLES